MAAELEQAGAALVEAIARGDAAAAAALYTDDGRLLTVTASLLTGRAEIEAFWRAGIAVGVGLAIATDDLQVLDGLAIEVGSYALTSVDGGRDGGKFVALHRRGPDGTWRRAIDVFNPEDAV